MGDEIVKGEEHAVYKSEQSGKILVWQVEKHWSINSYWINKWIVTASNWFDFTEPQFSVCEVVTAVPGLIWLLLGAHGVWHLWEYSVICLNFASDLGTF